ncbi:hypothetical protein [Aeromicrobium sp. P5_D10]
MFSIQPVEVILNGESYWLAYLINNGDGTDQVLLDADGCVVTGRDMLGLEIELRSRGLAVSPESRETVVTILLDGLIPIPREQLSPEIARVLWDGWSFIDDVCLTIGRPLGFQGQIARRTLDKLFWGINLQEVIPPGVTYTPVVSAKEQAKWQQIIMAGRGRLESALRSSRE